MWIECNLPWKVKPNLDSEKITSISDEIKIKEKDATKEELDSLWKRWYKEYEKESKKSNELSFHGKGLAIPGTVIQYNNNKGKLVTELIGNLNASGGYCDDCPIESEAVIFRYKVVNYLD